MRILTAEDKLVLKVLHAMERTGHYAWRLLLTQEKERCFWQQQRRTKTCRCMPCHGHLAADLPQSMEVSRTEQRDDDKSGAAQRLLKGAKIHQEYHTSANKHLAV